MTIRLVHAIAAACKAEPSLNAWYNSQAGERRLHRRVDVGIAIDLEGGLIVPVLRNVGERDRARFARRARADAGRCRRALDPAGGAARRNDHIVELRHDRRALCQPRRGAAPGGDHRGRSRRERVVADRGDAAIHRMLPLSLTFDHRIVTGGEAARFLVALKSDLERAS